MAHTPQRLRALRAAMREARLDVLYVRTLSNIAWLTGFEKVFDSEQAHAVILTKDRTILHSDSRYVEALQACAQGTEIEITIERGAHSTILLNCCTALCETSASDWVSREDCTGQALGWLRIGIEDSISLSEYRSLEQAMCELPEISLIELDRFVETLRQVKDAHEVELMRHAQAITDAAFARILTFIRPGMTEREVQLQLDRYMFEEGAEGLAFDTIVASGAHGAVPHAIPGHTRLEVGDAVVMDFGARYAGYCADMTRTVFIGTPSPELAKAWETLCTVNERCEAFIKEGRSAKEVHLLAEELLAKAGYANCMGHSLGHSVGLDIHEGPNLSPVSEATLQAGNVVTVEPGIYISGKFGMRLEDFGVVTHKGFEVFTKTSHKMFIIDTLN